METFRTHVLRGKTIVGSGWVLTYVQNITCVAVNWTCTLFAWLGSGPRWLQHVPLCRLCLVVLSFFGEPQVESEPCVGNLQYLLVSFVSFIYDRYYMCLPVLSFDRSFVQ